MKNECLKTRPESNPYEVWKNERAGWTWKVLQKYQADDNEPHARWFCAVSSPCTFGQSGLGDVYASEVKANAVKVS